MSTGYSAIVKLLNSETENDTEDKRKLLALMSRQLVYNIHVDEFLDLLFEAGLLNEEDKEIVESEKRNNGLLAAAHKIFNIIPTKSHEWVQPLTDILKKCGLGDVAELLSFSEDRQMSPVTGMDYRRFIISFPLIFMQIMSYFQSIEISK
jgi:hypothetical protein